MSYIGDFRLGDTFDTKFCTVSTTGAPTTMAGSPVISAYVGNSTTELTAGITLSVDFDSRTGMHNVRVVATSGNGYATASNYQLVLTAGTVGGTSVVGYVVAEFSVEARSALMPTTAARTLDVTAANKVNGVVLVDTLTTYTGNTVQTGDSFARIGAAGAGLTNIDLPNQTMDIIGNITGNLSGSVGSVTGNVSGTVATVTNLTNAPTAGDFTATMKTSIGTAVAASAVASVTGNVGGNVTGSVGSVVGAVGSVTGAVGSVTGLTAANLDATISSRATPAQVNTEVVDALNVDTYAEPGQVAPPVTTTLVTKIGYLYKFLRNKKTQTATELNVWADNGTTVDQKATVSDDGTTYTHGEITNGP